MPNYRRAKITGATWFFTVNLLERHNNNLLIKEIALKFGVVIIVWTLSLSIDMRTITLR